MAKLEINIPTDQVDRVKSAFKVETLEDFKTKIVDIIKREVRSFEVTEAKNAAIQAAHDAEGPELT